MPPQRLTFADGAVRDLDLPERLASGRRTRHFVRPNGAALAPDAIDERAAQAVLPAVATGVAWRRGSGDERE